MLQLADSLSGRVELVARGVQDDLHRGWVYERDSGSFQSDRNNESISPAALFALAAPGHELTLTVVSEGTGRRLGIDRDEDDYYDRTELELGLDPLDPLSRGSNAPPRLQPVSSISVHLGTPVSVTVGALDPNTPTQALTFTLVRDRPAGATIDSSTGSFSWLPTSEQSDRTYLIRVQVSDNGSPSMSDTVNFEVTVVTLRIERIKQRYPGSWELTFNSLSGKIYWLQRKETLEDPWYDHQRIWNTGGEIQVRDDWPPLGVQRFYRIRREQP